MNDEIWKDLKGYETIYQASSFGNIRRSDTKDGISRLLRPSPGIRYKTVKLYKDGISKTKTVHSLIAETFLDSPSCCPFCKTIFEVHHKDENKYNNRADNLEYLTHQENVKRSASKTRESQRKKLTDESIEDIRNLRKFGLSYRKIQKIHDVALSTIGDVLNKNSYLTKF